MAVTLINCFEVPSGQEDEFFALWRQVNTYMQTKPGYLGHSLHRAMSPDALFRFVNVARWESESHFHAAHDEGFRELASQPGWKAFRFHPFLYEVVHQAEAVAA